MSDASAGSQPIPIEAPALLGVMRRVLAGVSLGLSIREGSLAQEELAARIPDLFAMHAD